MKRYWLCVAAALIFGCQSIPEGEPPAGAITSNQPQAVTPDQAALSLAAFFLMDQELSKEIIVTDHPLVRQIFVAANRVIALENSSAGASILEYTNGTLVLRRVSDAGILWQFEGL